MNKLTVEMIFKLRDSFSNNDEFAICFDILRALHEGGKPMTAEQIMESIQKRNR